MLTFLIETLFSCLFTQYDYEYKKIERINSTGSFIKYNINDN